MLVTATNFAIDFMRWRKVAAVASTVLVLASIGTLAVNQLEWGLDFTGGTLVEVAYPDAVNPETIRLQLDEAGYAGHVVQFFGSDRDILVRVPPQDSAESEQAAGREADRGEAKLGDNVFETLAGNASLSACVGTVPESGPIGCLAKRRIEFVGPAVGEELRDQGGLGVLTALGLVMLYIAFRFQIKFSVGAVVALFHDVMIALGVFSILRWDFDLTVLAAMLAVIGYSLNDTIVVSDRIRENFRKIRRGTPTEIINTSLNQTLGRTLVTSFTTLLVLFALLLLGGELIRGFALGLIIGVIVGTYSSIYIAANSLLALGITKDDLAVPVKEGAEADDVPQNF